MRILSLSALILTGAVHAETSFEAFYRVERRGQHIGFVVQRLRRDGDQRVVTSYVRLRQSDGTEIFESVKATARADGAPVAAEHLGRSAGFPAIFARFNGPRGRVDFGARETRRPASVEKYDFLSSFLFYVANLTALKAGGVYKYHAFAEDRGSVQTGTMHVAGVFKVGEITGYHLLDDFEGEPIEHFVAANGQPLGSRALGGGLVAYWVPTREEAIDVFKYPNHDVIAVFGDLPAGANNVWAAVPGLRADRVIAARPKWTGQRVLSVATRAKVPMLPRRAL